MVTSTSWKATLMRIGASEQSGPPFRGGQHPEGWCMDRISVAQARKVEAVGREVRLQGWVRTRRDSKGGFSFLELNDGSCLGNVQVIAGAALPNYQADVLPLSVGSSVTVEGTVQASPAKGQATEVRASRV